MLDLREAAKSARNRVTMRLQAAESENQDVPTSAAIVQQGSSFRVRLFEALRRAPRGREAATSAPNPFFLAFPEKLLEKWYYLAFGPQRTRKGEADRPATEAQWHVWNTLGDEVKLVNFKDSPPKAVLVAHGLSAIDDSILLLADLGRAFRAGRAIKVPVEVLQAGISWISYNRSLKRFDLKEREIETGLRLCQERRRLLYDALGAISTIHEIVGHAKKGAISSKKIQMIADRYVDLAGMVWGEDNVGTFQPLEYHAVAAIGKPLHLFIGEKSPLQALSRFPGALQALEKALAPHLSVMRTIAQRFRLLSLDTFSYYFAQFYAQDCYRLKHVKIAPVSERDFDEPFDDLDESFRSWGEGHELSVSPPSASRVRRKRLTAVYLPHYRIGDWELLPYTPLSLTGVEQSGGKISTLKDRVILLSDNTVDHRVKVRKLLRSTIEKSGAARLNRLVYDVLSFVEAAVLAQGRQTLDEICSKASVTLDGVLRGLNRDLPDFFSVECEKSANLAHLWFSWLDAIELDSPPKYIPCHILIATMTESDWTEECLDACATFFVIANSLATELST